jgi:hypothetical protein
VVADASDEECTVSVDVVSRRPYCRLGIATTIRIRHDNTRRNGGTYVYTRSEIRFLFPIARDICASIVEAAVDPICSVHGRMKSLIRGWTDDRVCRR